MTLFYNFVLTLDKRLSFNYITATMIILFKELGEILPAWLCVLRSVNFTKKSYVQVQFYIIIKLIHVRLICVAALKRNKTFILFVV